MCKLSNVNQCRFIEVQMLFSVRKQPNFSTSERCCMQIVACPPPHRHNVPFLLLRLPSRPPPPARHTCRRGLSNSTARMLSLRQTTLERLDEMGRAQLRSTGWEMHEHATQAGSVWSDFAGWETKINFNSLIGTNSSILIPDSGSYQ